MGRELNKSYLHRRDGIKLNGRLGKDKWGVGNFLARPKSITLTWLPYFPMPIKKLSGLMS